MPRQYEDNETRRRQVAEAALLTIAEDGVASFTTRAVAGRVGISDGTLFRHFGSKKEIVLEAMKLLRAGIEEGLVETGDASSDLEGFFRHRAAFVGANGSVGRLIFSDELIHLAGTEGRSEVEEWRRKSVGYLLVRLGSLRMGGKLRSDLDLPAMGMLIQGALLTFAMQASLGRQGSGEELQARVDHAWKALDTILFQH
jgi:TetR/AcrR family transcriptional regulator